jgi:hypothetical protein
MPKAVRKKPSVFYLKSVLSEVSFRCRAKWVVRKILLFGVLGAGKPRLAFEKGRFG